MTTDIEAIRARWAKVPAGPWRWGGSITAHDIYLSTVDRGRIFLMQFRRFGMRDAQPAFPVNATDGSGVVRGVYEAAVDGPARQRVEQIGLVVKEREYRGDIEDIDNPVAQCLKHSVTDVADLLAEVDRLRGELAACGRQEAA